MKDISQVLKTLNEDYALRNALLRKGLVVQEELEDEIDDLEQAYITSVAIPKLQEMANELLKDLHCEVALSVMKDANGKVIVTDEFVGRYNSSDTPSSPIAEDDVPSGNSIVLNSSNVYEAEGRFLRVTFSDGTVFEGKVAKDVFINTLKKIGLDRIPAVAIKFIDGHYNLVDRNRRIDGSRKWQQEVDGYWVYIYTSNSVKIAQLLKIDNFYGLGLKIEAVEKNNK